METSKQGLELEKLLESNKKNLQPHLLRFTKLQDAVDESGKLFHIDLNDENKVYLFLPEIDKRICLGRIVVGKNHLLYHKFEDEKQIHRNTNSWSINYKVFEAVDDIYYETLRHNYTITKERAEEFGQVVTAPYNEKKIYVPLQYWNKHHKGIDAREKYKRKLIGDSWYNKLKHVIDSEHMTTIIKWLRKERLFKTIYPEEEKIFRAFKLCTFEHTKVVIIGQDPYNDGSADGLAFSFNQEAKRKATKSLDLIVKEVERDCYDGFLLDRFDYDLSVWARQGVLLLNTVLTVEKYKPLSHWDIGWRRFTRKVLVDLLTDIQPKVFIAWGSKAIEVLKEAADKANLPKHHLFLTAKHPASDLYNNQNSMGIVEPNYPETFSGCKHFSQANAFLKKHNRKEIKW